MRTPRPTALALVATLALTAAALAGFLAGAPIGAPTYLLLFTCLFALRVGGQLAVAFLRPGWLPPMEQWNLVPYRVLLPAQAVIVALMGALVVGAVAPGPGVARGLVAFAFVYWTAMGLRYGVRMARRPEQRWLGGTIPIVFHCVLAACLFVLGMSHA